MKEISNEDILEALKRLFELLRQTDGSKGSIELVYVASGAQHIDRIDHQTIYVDSHSDTRCIRKEAAQDNSPSALTDEERHIRDSIARLMEEQTAGHEPLFNRQGHWQAIYRILVDNGYCKDSDFDGFDRFIQRVMPDYVNKPYKKSSVKNISQTDFNKPFDRWHYDPVTSGTRHPYDRMVEVARRFKEILAEKVSQI